uniref:Uncharacterized protein n=1 Tax=Oryza rufipogon TaxID=4529 RepID=A0A0E0PBS8_ORYRU
MGANENGFNGMVKCWKTSGFGADMDRRQGTSIRMKTYDLGISSTQIDTCHDTITRFPIRTVVACYIEQENDLQKNY